MADQFETVYKVIDFGNPGATLLDAAAFNNRFSDINDRLKRLEEEGTFSLLVSKPGDLVGLGGGTAIYIFPCPANIKNVKVSLGVATSPIGSDLIIDVRKGLEPSGGATGTSLFVTNPNPKIPNGSGTGISALFAADTGITFNIGDAIGVVIDQVGSGVPGNDLTVVITAEPTEPAVP